MGCCASTNKASISKKESHSELGLQSFNKKSILENRAPPPSAEEETVKEVLSETPNLKASPKARIFIPRQEEVEKEDKTTQIEKPVFVEIQEKDIKTEPKPPVNVVEESASEDVSEICSVSVSESVSVRDDEEEEVRPRRVIRSQARTGSINRVVGRSPTRKLDQSPARRNGVRSVQNRDPTVRRGSRPDPTKKDPGESSGRRSRSPAVNRSVTGRSPSGRKTTNQSPGRVRPDPGESGDSKKTEHQHHHQQQWPSSNNSGAAAATTSSEPNESLENPLVSLECFIFL